MLNRIQVHPAREPVSVSYRKLQGFKTSAIGSLVVGLGGIPSRVLEMRKTRISRWFDRNFQANQNEE